MLRIHNLLKSGSYPNCSKLAREMEVSSKTISRDIDFMRDRMMLPIEYQPDRHGYFYTREVHSLPTIDISEGELLALSIAQKAMDHYKGTPFERPLSNALAKLAASLPDTITANLTELSETISFRHGRLSEVDETLLQEFTKAALEKREISFQYKKLGAKKAETRNLLPYHLTNFLGKWYAIGWDEKRQAIRTFLLNRASAAKLGDRSFTTPGSFSPEDYLGSSFGIYSPTGKRKVSIRFKSPVSEYIEENTWHPSQKIESRKDGSIVIHFDLGSLLEVTSWILSWGPNAQVLAPKELKETIKRTANEVAALY